MLIRFPGNIVGFATLQANADRTNSRGKTAKISREPYKSPSRNNRIDFELYLKSRLVNKALAELGDLKKRYRKRASKIERLFLDGP